MSGERFPVPLALIRDQTVCELYRGKKQRQEFICMGEGQEHPQSDGTGSC